MSRQTVFESNKVFSGEKFIHNKLLNIFGLHLIRFLLAHFFYNVRTKKFFPTLTPNQEIIRNDGIVIIKNFLSKEHFEKLKQEFQNIEKFEGNHYVVTDGDSYWKRHQFTPRQWKKIPYTNRMLNDSRIFEIVKAAEARNEISIDDIWFDDITCIENSEIDSQKELHRDVFYHTHKAWFFLDEVKEENGPLTVLPSSHRLSFKRAFFEYKKSIFHKKEMDDSFRINEQEKKQWLQEVKAIVPANSLVVANVSAFHKRGNFKVGAKRTAIFFSFRHNPFTIKPELVKLQK